MQNDVILMRKPIHEANGYLVSEVTEMVNGIQQKRYQILDSNDKPVTSKCSSLDYVMSIFKCYTA
jgi:hypothetical protein